MKKINEGIVLILATIAIVSGWYAVNTYKHVRELELQNEQLIEQSLEEKEITKPELISFYVKNLMR